MSEPMLFQQMLTALRNEGLNPIEHRSWRTHNRNHKGPWGPVYGIVIHHTAGVGSGMADFCYNGNADLPGPLCHAFLAKSGAIYMIGNGRTNHAGTFAANAHQAVLQESVTHPYPDAAEPIDGNRHYYGIEIENKGDGKDSYPPGQYAAVVRWAAAICRFHGWTEQSIIGHKEGTRRKIDPSFSMNKFRADVAEQLRAGRPVPPKPATPTAPATTTGDGMPDFTSLAYTGAGLSFVAGQSRTIYWDAEYQDGAGDHGVGGKTIVSGEHFTGTLALHFTAPLPPGVEIRMVHELDAGGVSDDYTVQLTSGMTDFAVPLTARVAEDRNMVIEIENGSANTINLAWAAVRGATWPL